MTRADTEILGAIRLFLSERGCSTEIGRFNSYHARLPGHRYWWTVGVTCDDQNGEAMVELTSNRVAEPVLLPLSDPNLLETILVHLGSTG